MTEQAQETITPEGNNTPQDTPQDTSQDTSQKQEPSIPKHRFDEVNKAKKQAETELSKLRNEQQQREEETAKNQGEYQQLAEKRQKTIDTLKQEVSDLKTQMVRDKRYRAWVAGASGAIKTAALGDAFEMVTEDEWATVNEDDENSIRMLAQNLAERKEYLAAGPIGAGSGGSKKPVYGLGSNNSSNNGVKTSTQGSRPTMHFKKQRPSWK